MTTQHATLAALIERLREHGYRITTQRRLVLETLLESNREAHHHFSCEDVTQRLVARGIDLDTATVYRILQWLKEADVVAQTDLGQGHDVYSLLGDIPHHHLICLHCGAVIEADDDPFEPLRESLRERYGFQARIEHFAIFGLCADCARLPQE
jgi:Fur family ferric uptake transcriptional regulator